MAWDQNSISMSIYKSCTRALHRDMTRGNGQSLSVDPVEMMKLMAQMQRCFLGGSMLGAPTQPKDPVIEAQKEAIIASLKGHHEQVLHYYGGHNRSLIDKLKEKMDSIGEKIRTIREDAKQATDRKEYYTQHSKINLGTELAEKVNERLNRERNEYVETALRVLNRGNVSRSRDFVENVFPKFELPAFMKKNTEYSLRKMMTWLRHTKAKLFKLYYMHIAMNTLDPSDIEPGNTHGRVERTEAMAMYKKYSDAAHADILKLRRIRRNANPKSKEKRKSSPKEEGGEGGKGRRQRRRKGKAAPGAAYGLTPFPYLHDYDDY